MSPGRAVPLGPAESGQLISSRAKHVTIQPAGVETVAKLFLDDLDTKRGRAVGEGYRAHVLHPRPGDADAVDWIFLVTSLNFNFWTPAGCTKYEVELDGHRYTGYFSVCAAINRAKRDGVPITDPVYYSQMDLATLQQVFRSATNTVIPLIEQRLEVMRQTGKVLVDKYGGSFMNCLKACDHSAQELLKLVITEFPSYRDEALFEGQRVAFYKRAQILIGDLWCCFDGEGPGRFEDIGTVTMFADYRVPQALAYLGALEYSPELTKLLKEEHMFSSGDRMEVEIRGCSIEAVRRVVTEVRRLADASGRGTLPDAEVNDILVDNFLWDYRRKFAKETDSVPYHKVRCCFY